MDHLWCRGSNTVFAADALRRATQHVNDSAVVQALSSFGNVESGGCTDTEFLERFWELFKIDAYCSCKTFAKRKNARVTVPDRPITAGKSGEVWMMTDAAGNKAVLKRTRKPVSTGPLSATIKRAPPDVIVGVGLDNFATQSIVSFLVATILDKHGNRAFLRQHDAFICSGLGYAVLEAADQGDLSDFIQRFASTGTDAQLDDVIFTAIVDVMGALAILKRPEYQFVHADLKAKNVFVATGPDGKPVFKIADFDKSSISWNGIRFYNRGGSAASVFSSEPPPPVLHRNDTYKLPHQTLALASPRTAGNRMSVETMFSPAAFHSSFDFYTLILSIAREPVVNKAMQRGGLPIFESVFAVMWPTRKDYEVMLERTNASVAAGKVDDLRSIAVTVGSIAAAGVSMYSDIGELYKFFKVEEPPEMRPPPASPRRASENGRIYTDCAL